MSKFKSVDRDGYVWLVYVASTGAEIWLYRQCRVGDRMRPGQRLRA